MSQFSFPVVRVAVASTYECLLALSVFSDAEGPERYDVGAAWFERLRRLASADLQAEIRRFSGGSDKPFVHLVALAANLLPSRDVPGFLDRLAATDPLEIRLHLLGYYLRYFRRATPAEVMRSAADGDAAARREFLRTSYPDDGPWQKGLRFLLPLDPEQTKQRLWDLLRRWYDEVFRSQEGELLPVLERDAEAKQALAAALAPEALIERVTGGFDYVPEPGIRTILLIPSVVIRPWIHVIDHQETKIICVGVAESSLTADADAPPARLLALTRALGDERRLRVLRALARREASLADLSAVFGLPKTTMHHHLAILREAGLIRLRSSDNRYRLRREVFPLVSELLVDYLEEDDHAL